jgi:hypothetical protein
MNCLFASFVLKFRLGKYCRIKQRQERFPAAGIKLQPQGNSGKKLFFDLTVLVPKAADFMTSGADFMTDINSVLKQF